MNKAAALATMNAMEGAKLPGSAIMSFPGGVETWAIALDTSHTYSGTDLLNIANYCATNALTLSAQFSAFGIV